RLHGNVDDNFFLFGAKRDPAHALGSLAVRGCLRFRAFSSRELDGHVDINRFAVELREVELAVNVAAREVPEPRAVMRILTDAERQEGDDPFPTELVLFGRRDEARGQKCQSPSLGALLVLGPLELVAPRRVREASELVERKSQELEGRE